MLEQRDVRNAEMQPDACNEIPDSRRRGTVAWGTSLTRAIDGGICSYGED